MDYLRIEKSARVRGRVVKTITYILLTFWALMVLFPFYWMILTSVKSYGECSMGRNLEAFIIKNYKKAIDYLNSLEIPVALLGRDTIMIGVFLCFSELRIKL